MVTGDAMNPNTRIGITTKDTPEAVQTLVSENINKQYKDGIKANTDITLSVRPGEILVLLRSNSAGKSTLVRQITIELIPSSGSIRVFGIDVVAEPTRAKNVKRIVP